MYIYPSNPNYKFIYKQKQEITRENQQYLNLFKTSLAKKGSGVLNTVLNNIPLPELHMSLPSHIPSEYIENGSFNNTGKYSFCGPKTKVRKRLYEGYKGVNDLDKACKDHDIFYSNHKDTKDRNYADDILAKKASEISLDETNPEYERKDARLVTGLMGIKSRFGMGVKKKKNPRGIISTDIL